MLNASNRLRRLSTDEGVDFFAAVASGDGRVYIAGGDRTGAGVLLKTDGRALEKVAIRDVGVLYDLTRFGDGLLLCDASASLIQLDHRRCTSRKALPSPLMRAFGVVAAKDGHTWVAGFDDAGNPRAPNAQFGSGRSRQVVAVSADGNDFHPIGLPEPWCDCVWPLTSTSHGVLLPAITLERGLKQLWLGQGTEIKKTGLKSGDFRLQGAAETAAGTLLVADNTWQVHRSEDGGKCWRKKRIGWFGYNGLCCVVPFSEQRVVVAGRKGFIALSDNDGRTFSPLQHDCGDADLMSGAALDDGFVLVGTRGQLLVWS